MLLRENFNFRRLNKLVNFLKMKLNFTINTRNSLNVHYNLKMRTRK